MFGESGTSRTGEVHRYYKCATAKKHKGCKKKTVRKQWLEDLVVNQTMQLVKDDAAMESIIAKVMELQNKENTNIPLYEKQLRDAESGIQNMLNAIQAGILTSSTKERLEQLEETKRELEARIAEEKLAKPKVTEEFIRFWLLRFRKLDMSLKDQRQALVDTFINAIYLYDDKVLITFNYKEGTQTVTFGEATEVASEGNGSDLDCFTAAGGSGTAAGCQRTSHQNGYGGAHHALVFHFDFPPSISGALSRVPLSLSLSYTFFHNLRMDASDLFLEQIRLFTETGLLLLTKSDPFKGMCPGWNRFYGKIMLLSVRDVF